MCMTCNDMAQPILTASYEQPIILACDQHMFFPVTLNILCVL